VSQSNNKNTGQQLASGAAWMISLRWVMRALNFGVVIFLARLLTPDDFGIFAIALMVLGIIELIGEGGLEFALIRQDTVANEYFDSGWTLQIILGFLTGALIFASGPLVAWVFDESRANMVLQILSLRAILLGFTNIGVVCFLKDFGFHNEFIFNVGKGFAEGLVTIALAFILRDFMALVLGAVFAGFLTVVMSYFLHPYRPRLSLAKINEIWAFSGWIVVADLAEEAVSIVDRIIVGVISTTSTLGLYHMAASVGNTMFESTIFPLWRGLFPTYARLARFPKVLAKVFLVVFSWVSIVACAVGFGVAAVANELVLALLGEQWIDAVALVPWLSLATGITAVIDNPLLVLTALGYTRLCALQSIGRLALLGIVLPATALLWGIEAMAIGLFVVTLIYLPVQIYYFLVHVPVTLKAFMAAVWRPLVSGIVMFLVVRLVAGNLAVAPVLALLIEAAAGGVVFTGLLYLLWILQGKPAGPESTMLEKVTPYLRLSYNRVQ
jgi:lipopolysaccharide exporter